MKKRVLNILLCLCMVLALCPVTAFADEPPGTLIGDIDGDGVVSPQDVVMLQNYLEDMTELTADQLIVADFNGDGEVNYSDLTALQNSLELPVSDITVTNGKATVCGTEIGKAAKGTRVTLTADSPSDNMEFDKWVVNEGGVTLADASRATTTFAMPEAPVSVTAAYKPLSAGEKYTLTVPFTITVKKGGNTAPRKTTFELELVNERGEKLSFDDVEVSGSVTTNGKGSYDGKLTITGPEQTLWLMLSDGAFVRQVNEGKPNWKYDDTVWGLRLRFFAELADDAAPENTVFIFPATKNTDDGLLYSMVEGANQVERMTFTNTYTKSTYKPSESGTNTGTVSSPQTGDNSNLAVWFALLAVSAAGVMGAGVYSKRRRSSR